MTSPRYAAARSRWSLALTQARAAVPSYLIQATAGQMAIVRARRPVAEVLARSRARRRELRHKLEGAQEALRFAHAALALPDNGSYRQYADLHRPYRRLERVRRAGVLAGVADLVFPGRGLRRLPRLLRGAARAGVSLRTCAAHGDDVHVGGAAAYSTLGFFRDPLLSSVVRLPDAALAGLIFHELAHQQLYVPG